MRAAGWGGGVRAAGVAGRGGGAGAWVGCRAPVLVVVCLVEVGLGDVAREVVVVEGDDLVPRQQLSL